MSILVSIGYVGLIVGGAGAWMYFKRLRPMEEFLAEKKLLKEFDSWIEAKEIEKMKKEREKEIQQKYNTYEDEKEW